MKLKLNISLICFLLYACQSFAFSVTHNLKIEIGLFNATNCSYSYSINDKSYSSDTKFQTTGLIGSLYPFIGEFHSDGIFNNENIYTGHYTQTTQSRFNKRSKTLLFDNNGKILQRISTKNKKTKKVDINLDNDKQYLYDLQTVFVKFISCLKNNQTCNNTYPVFNGKHTFDVTFKYLDKELLQNPINKNQYSDALKYSVFIKSDHSKDGNLMFETTSDENIIFWLIKDKKTNLPYLAKLVVEHSPLGKITASPESTDIKE